VIAAAAIAEFGAVVLLSFSYSGQREGAATEILHLSVFVLLAGLILLSLTRTSQFRRITAASSDSRERARRSESGATSR